MITPEKLAEACPPKQEGRTSERRTGAGSGRGIAETPQALRVYLESLGVRITCEKQSNGAVALVLDGCPMNPEHGHNTDTAVLWRPTGIGFKCQHDSCGQYGWLDARAKLDPAYASRAHARGRTSTEATSLPEVVLPGGSQSIRAASQQLGILLGCTERLFVRGRVVVEVVRDDHDRPFLETVKPAALASSFESVADLKRPREDGALMDATCNEQTAKLVLHSGAFLKELPPLRLVAHCPVLIERDAELVQIVGYDRESAILAHGDRAPDISLQDAIGLISDLVADFRFATESDRSRAIAAFITPALVFSGILGGRPPVDLGEADESQAGKGYRNKLTAAMYGSTVTVVSQRRGGVGGMEESFDQALIRGANLISLDNMRGKLDSPRIESFLTEDVYLARVPYSGNIEIDPHRVITMMTSNKAEITPDLANRSSIVRILKQPAEYHFRQYPEGELLLHVRANQPRYLGAVFAIVRAWYEAGMPCTEVRGHDFRAWAGRLDWIVQRIFKSAPLLDGHREAQSRVASAGLNWLRDVAIAVHRAERLDTPLRPHELLEILEAAGAALHGVADSDDLADEDVRLKACRAIGQKLGACFRKGPTVEVDRYAVSRIEGEDSAGRTQRTYVFSLVSRISPNVPESHPESFCLFPESPESFPNKSQCQNDPVIGKYVNHSGDSGDSGNKGFTAQTFGKPGSNVEVLDL